MGWEEKGSLKGPPGADAVWINLTRQNYDALPQAQKDDPTILYLIKG